LRLSVRKQTRLERMFGKSGGVLCSLLQTRQLQQQHRWRVLTQQTVPAGGLAGAWRRRVPRRRLLSHLGRPAPVRAAVRGPVVGVDPGHRARGRLSVRNARRPRVDGAQGAAGAAAPAAPGALDGLDGHHHRGGLDARRPQPAVGHRALQGRRTHQVHPFAASQRHPQDASQKGESAFSFYYILTPSSFSVVIFNGKVRL